MVSNNSSLATVKKFIIAVQGTSPIVPANAVATLPIKVKCRCGNPLTIQLQHSMGGSLLADIHSMLEMFEKVGTNVSMTTGDVLAGARIKDIGARVIEWCGRAGIGETRDIIQLAATITRIADDTETVERIDLRPQPEMRLVGVG